LLSTGAAGYSRRSDDRTALRIKFHTSLSGEQAQLRVAVF
jgi:hypothetical protein